MESRPSRFQTSVLKHAGWLAGSCAVLVFWPALHDGFVNWDDSRNLVTNPHFRSLGIESFRWMFGQALDGHYIPLTWLSFALDYAVWGMAPLGYHLTNVLLHGLNVALFYYVTVNLLGWNSGRTTLSIQAGALAAALIFGLHPLRVESVAWVTERRDLLSGALLLASLLAYLYHCRGRRGWLGISLVLYALSLLSKAVGMVFPAVLIVLDIFPLGRLGGSRAKKILGEKTPFILLAILAMAVSGWAMAASGAAMSWADHRPDQRLAQAAYGSIFYLGKFFWPARLSPLYIFPSGISLFAPRFAAAVLALAGVSGFLWWRRRAWPWALAGWCIYLALIAPVSGVFQSGAQLVADRYTYLGLMPAAVLAGAALAKLRRRDFKLAAGIGMAGLLALWAGLAHRQIGVWQDSMSLWTHVLSLGEGGYFAESGMAEALLERGQWAEAIPHYRRALAVMPTFPPALEGLAYALAKTGARDQAREIYRLFLRVQPNSAAGHANLGRILEGEGNTAEAAAHYEAALRLAPENAQLQENLARLKR